MSLALVEEAKILYCYKVRELRERCVKVTRSLSGIVNFANLVVAECRIEYADAPKIFNSFNSLVNSTLMSFVVVDLLKPLCHNKRLSYSLSVS
ncbi:MAG: hypothetical protein EZS28_032462, partial [Streblomastix strix]